MADYSRISMISLSVALASVATPSWAQTAPAGDSAVEAPTDELAPGEIIVTANKRNERLQDVAVSVQAVDGETLANRAITTPKDFGQISPTLNFQAADEARLFNFSIRGIGTESFSVGVEPSVSTIVDGVVYTRVGSVFDGLGDLERVEVLNGPQGTLQGKNASAGAVVITTAAPNRDRFAGKAEAGIAEHGEYLGNLMLTGPITDQLAFRVFGYYHTEDGVVRDIKTNKTINNSESYGVRAKLLWEPIDGSTITLAGDWSKRTADCCGEPIRIAAASGNVTAAFTGTPVGPDNTFVNFDTLQEGYQKNRGVSLTGDFGIGDHSLTTITAYRVYNDFAIRDRDGTNAPFAGVTPTELFRATNPGITPAAALTLMDNLLINPLSFSCRTTTRSTTEPVCGESQSYEFNKTFTQEVRLTSPTGGLIDYVAGLFYYNALTGRDLTIAGVRSNIAGNVTFPTPTTVVVSRDTAYVLADMQARVRNINYAAFANVNVHPTDQLTLTGGIRYVRDEIEFDLHKVTGPNGDHIGSPTGVNPAGQVAPGANAGTPQFNAFRSYGNDHVLGRVTAKYEFTPDVMAYVSWAHGYKGPAVDADIFVTQAGFDNTPVAPETSKAWEIGVKSQFLDRRVTVNLTGYSTTFSGYQTSSQGTDGSGPPVLRSAGKLFTKGIEGEIVVRPIDGLRLSGNFLFSDNKFGDLFLSATNNIKGGNPLNAPESKWTIVGSYDWMMGDFGINLNANYTHTGSTLFTNLADATNPNSIWIRHPFGVANAALNVTLPGENIKVGLYVKNLFDEHYVASLRRISGSVGGGGAVAQALPRDFDRYVGGTVSVKF
ncbi:iron complex outermembrane receptor protein [Novosphingobium kunmingense]|uniref:Iron complex outermembrane receptor protein n=1 Tax=Novosphingobium kunmingense TaxID=1211806 RepID=A0A2N0H3H7_9SPHN|nr:TonB-dependent receptor [Novosphingobium kunmingense]PKB13495.1 iron complex outermembrane receptor protein [Novosphingobium kunmingense]